MSLNLAFWLSIVLAASSCFGLLLAGRGKWQGWAVGLATQPVWAWFAIVTKSYGLLLVGAMYTTVYAKNLWKWRKDAKRHQARDLYMNAWNKPIGQVLSVTQDERGLRVDYEIFNVDDDYAVLDGVAVNRIAGSELLRRDFESWQRDRDVHGTKDGSPDFTRKQQL